MTDSGTTEQRTSSWYQARCGKIGASRMGDLCAKLKSGAPAASRSDVIMQCVVERLTGSVTEHYVSRDMEWGMAYEDEARAAYEMVSGAFVETTGWVPHPAIEGSGASPDGLVGDDGLVEIKCPKTRTHVDFMLDGVIDPAYVLQMSWQLACTGRAWCDFVSYDPRLPDNLKLVVQRFSRNEALEAEMTLKVQTAIAEIEEMVATLRARA